MGGMEDYKMDLTFLIALVGALAWLPQIFSWIYNRLAKPKLCFSGENITEIGYTYLGLILNQSFAISTSQKDALIEKIILSVVHESGTTHDFYWDYLDEKGAEMTTTTGEKAEFRKSQKAIALKISTLGLTEKKIFFRDIAYQQRIRPFISALTEKASYFEKTEGDQWQEKIVKTKEFLDTLDAVKNGFQWKQGKYNVFLHAHETSLKRPHTENYGFTLSKSEIEQLEKNIGVTQEHLKDIFLYKGKDEKERPKRFWHWVNPLFYRVNKRR